MWNWKLWKWGQQDDRNGQQVYPGLQRLLLGEIQKIMYGVYARIWLFLERMAGFPDGQIELTNDEENDIIDEWAEY